MGSAAEVKSGLDICKLLTTSESVENKVTLTGKSLTIADLHAFIKGKITEVSIAKDAQTSVINSHEFLTSHIDSGACIYGVNTGFGGSADVRCEKDADVQRGLILHLNAGFGSTLPSWLVKGVMLVRANSLSLGYSAVTPEILQRLVDLINNDIVPEVPKRGSVSASGDLMPASYIAACLEGRQDLKVCFHGERMLAPEAFNRTGLSPVTLTGKDGLALINSSSFAAVLGSDLLYRSCPAIMLTQLAVSLSVEALNGRLESFHPVLHDRCLPHPGQSEVARNIRCLLEGTKMALTQYEIERGRLDGVLRQDRYALRTSPQWLGPVVETVSRLQETLTIELNSANDNPIVDPHSKLVVHGGNFQGTAITVAMDQLRQSLQLCGKLLFALMSEVMDVTINNGLTPNLCGGDPRVDMGFKGTETAMAAYMSELDYLTNPLTNHVLSAELRNQSVNSLALISARQTEQALELLQMQITNIINALVQAIDLRWIKTKVENEIRKILMHSNIKDCNIVLKLFPWYEFLYLPHETMEKMLKDLPGTLTDNGLDLESMEDCICPIMEQIYKSLKDGEYTTQVESSLGKGTRQLYSYIRRTLGIGFQDGSRPLDTYLQTIYESITEEHINDLVISLCHLCKI